MSYYRYDNSYNHEPVLVRATLFFVVSILSCRALSQHVLELPMRSSPFCTPFFLQSACRILTGPSYLWIQAPTGETGISTAIVRCPFIDNYLLAVIERRLEMVRNHAHDWP